MTRIYKKFFLTTSFVQKSKNRLKKPYYCICFIKISAKFVKINNFLVWIAIVCRKRAQIHDEIDSDLKAQNLM